VTAAAIIRERLNRIRLGNFGDSKSVGGGVEELRIETAKSVVRLLGGGSKHTQSKDIQIARALWKDYLDGKD
jgi:putative addiction module killer protein